MLSLLHAARRCPGASCPRRNSSDAPPPVDRWSTGLGRSNRARARPGCRRRPTTVNAGRRRRPPGPPRASPPRTAPARTSPIGPFHSTVRASAIVRANSSTRPRADVQAHRSRRDLVGRHGPAFARPRVGSGGRHDVLGQLDHDALAPPRLSRAAHVVEPVGLDERPADLDPLGRQEREGHRPTDQEGVHPVDQRVHHGQLVGDLGAAEDGHERALGVLAEPGQRPRPRAAAAGPRRHGRQLGDRRPREACAPVGGAERVVDVGVGQRGERRRRTRDRSPPRPGRTGGSPAGPPSRARPRRRPPRPSGPTTWSSSVDGGPERLGQRARPRARGGARPRPLPFGRPRWEHTTSAAPRRGARGGSEAVARIRRSSVIRPSSSGTLRSHRTRTRFPSRSPRSSSVRRRSRSPSAASA